MVKNCIRRLLAHERLGRNARSVLRATRTARLLPDHVKRLMPETGEFSISLPDGRSARLHCPGPEDGVAIRLYWDGFKGYEPETTALFYHLCSRGVCAIDVGAYTGYYTLLAAIANPTNRVISFEPWPPNCEHLIKNIRLNHLANVRAEPLIVSGQAGEMTLYVPDVDLPSSASTLAGFRQAATAIRKASITLDIYATTHGLDRIDVVKIDTEATEHEVLQGMSEIMERDAPMIFCEVLRGRNEAEQQAVLAEHGYRWFWITDRGLICQRDIRGDPDYRFSNYLYVHPRRADLCQMLPDEARRWLSA
ncbi:MAG: FkbM family methyltransferase [Phycisphaerales bacterium]|nr:MAG: FkbM family methyltransferase [Phycisphaerales bacterium]